MASSDFSLSMSHLGDSTRTGLRAPSTSGAQTDDVSRGLVLHQDDASYSAGLAAGAIESSDCLQSSTPGPSSQPSPAICQHYEPILLDWKLT